MNKKLQSGALAQPETRYCDRGMHAPKVVTSVPASHPSFLSHKEISFPGEEMYMSLNFMYYIVTCKYYISDMWIYLHTGMHFLYNVGVYAVLTIARCSYTHAKISSTIFIIVMFRKNI